MDNPEFKQQQQHNPLPVIAAYHLSILQQMTAIQVVYIYVGEIVGKVYPSLEHFLPIFIHGEGIAAIFLTIYSTKFLGRKTILQIGTLGCSACLFSISLSFFYLRSHEGNALASFLIVFSLFAFRAVFSFTFAPIHPVYLAEVVEPKHVANGSLLMFVFAGIISFLFPILNEYLGGPAPVFLLFAIYTLLAFFVNTILLIETKDKTEM
jgi:hypothetical protein